MALFFCYYCLCYLWHKSSFPRCMLRTSTVAQEINYMLSPWCFKLLLQNWIFWILDGWIIWRLSQWLVKEGPAHCMRLGHWKNSWLTDTHHEVRRVMKKTLTSLVEKSAIVNDALNVMSLWTSQKKKPVYCCFVSPREKKKPLHYCISLICLSRCYSFQHLNFAHLFWLLGSVLHCLCMLYLIKNCSNLCSWIEACI